MTHTYIDHKTPVSMAREIKIYVWPSTSEPFHKLEFELEAMLQEDEVVDSAKLAAPFQN
jgi:hypothetical protein